MKPGKLTLNAFESAIIDRIVAKEPRLESSCRDLRVLSREYTGVGSYTTFQVGEWPQGDRLIVTLDELIAVPGVPNGMGAALFCRGVQPEFLETFTYGNDHWDGSDDDFAIDEAG